MSLLVALALLGLLLAPSAAQSAEVTLRLPPPDLAPLLPLASPALDKGPVGSGPISLPPSPQPVPPLPPARIVVDLTQIPLAPAPPPRFLACNPLGTVLGVASELVECGRARFQRNEFEDAREALENAVKKSHERALLREARYWLAETLIRLRQTDGVERNLLLVVQDDPRSELGYYGGLAYGMVLLNAAQPARALDTFDTLLKAGAPPEVIPWARHGRALALYGLGRYADARETWTGLLALSLPRAVAGEAQFWLGDTLGRLGDYKNAVARLSTFTARGPQLNIESGLLRQAWWSRAGGQSLEAVQTYRGLLSAYPKMSEILWARAGLVLALLDIGDYAAALDEARRLEQADAKGTLALPVLLAVDRWATEKHRLDEGRTLSLELLGKNLEPVARAYVVLLGAELEREAKQPSEARSAFELVVNNPGRPTLGWYAGYRLAQIDIEGREFGQAQARLDALLRQPLDADIRAAVLVLGGEAGYAARDWDQAADRYGRFLSEYGSSPEAPSVQLALAWTQFRRGRFEEARKLWTQFATSQAKDPRAPGALLLASEIAARAGDTAGAQGLVDSLLQRYPEGEHAEVARLNRTILLLRAGKGASTVSDLTTLVRRAPLSSHIGRMRLARGAALMADGKPAEAAREFTAALGQGEGAVAHLGLGRIAFERSQWDEAEREFVEARDGGTGAIVAAAEYGIAAVLWNQGKREDFSRFATALLAQPADARTTPYVLGATALVAADERKWTEARGAALKLVKEFPDSDATPVVLAQVGAAAGRGGEWTLASDVLQTLATRYPTHGATRDVRLDYAEALVRTGAMAEARRRLQAFVDASSPEDKALPRALLLLGRSHETAGDQPQANDLYARVTRDYPAWEGAATLGQARVLMIDGKWAEAQPLLERALSASDVQVASEAAYRLGEGYRAAGRHQQAVDAYMTAAYVAPDTTLGRRALLGAGQSFAALKQPDFAVIVYKKLLASSGIEAELADAARKNLRALGVN
jgi:TolA-binding protein